MSIFVICVVNISAVIFLNKYITNIFGPLHFVIKELQQRCVISWSFYTLKMSKYVSALYWTNYVIVFIY